MKAERDTERIGLSDTVCSADVVPLGDVRKHTVPGGYDSRGEGWLAIESDRVGSEPRCRCSPRVDMHCSPDGSLDTVYVHRAWDQRELAERSIEHASDDE